jgi:acetate kinase
MSTVTINVGSSSARVAVFDGNLRHDLSLDPSRPDGLAAVATRPSVVVHRIVHGGPSLLATTTLDDATQAALADLTSLAPLHLPRALAWLNAARAAWPDATHLAVFDTSFYADLPPAAATYALPAAVRARYGIRRYGFHGLAHQSLLRALPARPRVVTVQLGSGASMTACRDGRAVDTTMGFSPLEGLVMATRAGDLDAGVLLHLLRNGVSLGALEQMLEHESGLRGLGGNGDMRALLARDDADARLAIDVYVHSARKHLGALLAVLGGCDAIAIGGGVGENAPAIRAALFAGFEWAGISIDSAANGDTVGRTARISAASSRVTVEVVRVDEAEVMRDEATRHLTQRKSS